jgi:Rieske 2Fe-2S family protein
MLGQEYFTSRAIYDQETERIFRRHWICVGRADLCNTEVPIRCVEVGDDGLLVVASEDGGVRCFHNVCRHRGAVLVEGDGDGLARSRLVCPYHGWVYDLRGRLVAAPHTDLPAGSSDQLSLLRVACRTWEGFVFVNLTAGEGTFDGVFGPLTDHFAPWQLAALIPVHTLTYEVHANWKLLFHNFSECYHCPGVHPALHRLTSFRSATNDLKRGMILGGPMELREGVESMSSDGRAIGPVLPGLNDVQRRYACFYTLFPTLFLSPHPDYVLTHRIERLDIDRTGVTCGFLCDRDTAAQPGFDPSRAVEFWDQVNRQDWHVCELTQRGVRSSGYRPGPYTAYEGMLVEFDRHYLQQLSRP